MRLPGADADTNEYDVAMSRCQSCAAEIDANVFPGATVRCVACGTENVVASAPLAAGDPYRGAAAVLTPAAAPVPTAPRGSVGPLCPRCARDLEDDAESAVACDRCRGKFVDHAVLAARIDNERPTARPLVHPVHARARPLERDVRYASCPTCRQMMARMNFGARSGVVVDVCRDHGTWFDGGELDAVLDFVRAGGLEDDPAALHAANARGAPSVDVEKMARAAEGALRVEALQQERAVAAATDLAGDLLFVLFGPRASLGWRSRW